MSFKRKLNIVFLGLGISLLCTQFTTAQQFDQTTFTGTGIKVINGVSVPSSFPELITGIGPLSGASSKKIFITNRGGNPYLLVYNSDGSPYFYRKLNFVAWDYQLQAENKMTVVGTGIVLVYDFEFNELKRLEFSDYSLDPHEFLLLPNGHYFLIKSAQRVLDLSGIVEGGRKNTTVLDAIIHEYNWSDSLVFEWNSKDYFQPQDASNENFSVAFIDYVHMNSIAVDYDENLIISSRNLSEVTKIDHRTGEIIWRLGGVNNQFTLIEDTVFFSYQHDAQPVPGAPGHYTVFDNGNFKNNVFSRVVEYEIDTLNRTATKVWEYRHEPDFHTRFMGSARRLDNGNTIINWADEHKPKVFEVSPSGETVYSANFENGDPAYRSNKHDWAHVAQAPYLIAESTPYKINLIFNKFGDRTVRQYYIEMRTETGSFRFADSTDKPYSELYDLENQQKYFFRVKAVDSSGVISGWSNIDSVITKFTPPGSNYLLNGGFANGLDHWNFIIEDSASAAASVTSTGELKISISKACQDFECIRLEQRGLPLIQGRKYQLSFDAWSTTGKLIEVNLAKISPPYNDYSRLGFQSIGKQLKQYIFNFEMTDPTDLNSALVINCGNSDNDLYLDNFNFIEVAPTGFEKTAISKEFTLFQNFPNPFNHVTKIDYSIKESRFVSLRVYSILGELVRVLENKYKNAGKYHVLWDGKNNLGKLAGSGVYIYSLSIGKQRVSKKMVLLK